MPDNPKGLKRIEEGSSRSMTTRGGRNIGLANEDKESVRGQHAGEGSGHTLSRGAYSRQGKVRGRLIQDEMGGTRTRGRP